MTTAVLGLGAMGVPIARALAAAGQTLHVCDVELERLAAVTDGVSLRTGSAGDAAAGADAVIVLVASDEQLETALLGDDGALARMAPGALLIVHSTVSPDLCRRVAAIAAERGVTMVDAPLSGGVAGAEARTLTTMVGGPAAALEAARPVLEAYTRTILHVGDVGLGQVAKLVNNLLATVHLAVTAEALDLARAVGLEEEAALSVVNACTGRSWATEGWRAILDAYERSPGGLDHVREAILRKDLDLVARLAERAAVAVPLTEAAGRSLERIGAREVVT